ncbi:MAG: hypothetical protein JXQ93_02830 [Flavobacteriaceae bacterium]
MIKFFRKIRQKLIIKNKTNQYLKYAIGEIVLVVIGILLALQINNWNSSRAEQNNIRNYYERIYDEISIVENGYRTFISKLDTLIHYNRRSLQILNTKNKDSIQQLNKTLGATATFWTSDLTLPIVEEFLTKDNLSKIQNDSIKIYFQVLSVFLKQSKITDSYIENQYTNTIEPYFIKNINYSKVALKRYIPRLIQGGPDNNLEKLIGNIEVWNMITFKLESLVGQKNYFIEYVAFLHKMKGKLKEELNK